MKGTTGFRVWRRSELNRLAKGLIPQPTARAAPMFDKGLTTERLADTF